MNKNIYFLGGRVICEKQSDGKYRCVLRPFSFFEKELMEVGQKYLETHRKGEIYLGEFKDLDFGADSVFIDDKGNVRAMFLGKKKRVCVIHGNEVLACGLSVEEKP